MLFLAFESISMKNKLPILFCISCIFCCEHISLCQSTNLSIEDVGEIKTVIIVFTDLKQKGKLNSLKPDDKGGEISFYMLDKSSKAKLNDADMISVIGNRERICVADIEFNGQAYKLLFGFEKDGVLLLKEYKKVEGKWQALSVSAGKQTIESIEAKSKDSK